MLNKIILSGRLVRDPEMRTTQSGKSIASFTLAVERDFAPQGQKKETDFINCTAWNGTADFMATVCGSLQIQNYTDRDGNKRSAPNVNVENVYFAGEKRAEKSDSGENSRSAAKGKSAYSSMPAAKQTFEEMEEATDDDFPF